MTDHSYIRNLHSQAMKLAEQALISKMTGDRKLSKSLYEEAFVIEEEVALFFLESTEQEPSRSIFFRSAASLANECKKYIAALVHIYLGLSGTPPSDLKVELEELRSIVYKNLKGTLKRRKLRFLFEYHVNNLLNTYIIENPGMAEFANIAIQNILVKRNVSKKERSSPAKPKQEPAFFDGKRLSK